MAVNRQHKNGTLLGAFAAFAAANVMHNHFGLDPAIVPAAVLISLYAWRPHRGLLWGAALFIAAPSFLFFKWRLLVQPGGVLPFLNQLGLLLGGVLALISVLQSLRPQPSTLHS